MYRTRYMPCIEIILISNAGICLPTASGFVFVAVAGGTTGATSLLYELRCCCCPLVLFATSYFVLRAKYLAVRITEIVTFVIFPACYSINCRAVVLPQVQDRVQTLAYSSIL